MTAIFHHLVAMSPMMLVTLGVLLLRLGLRYRQKKVVSTAHEVAVLLFWVFFMGLLSQTILPQGQPIRFSLERVNLVPGLVIKQTRHLMAEGNSTYFIINFLGNIAMFVPIGLGIPLLWRSNPPWLAVLWGFNLSLTIELCQLFVNRGTDVDDLILNTLGALIGALLALLLRKCCPKWTAHLSP